MALTVRYTNEEGTVYDSDSLIDYNDPLAETLEIGDFIYGAGYPTPLRITKRPDGTKKFYRIQERLPGLQA